MQELNHKKTEKKEQSIIGEDGAAFKLIYHVRLTESISEKKNMAVHVAAGDVPDRRSPGEHAENSLEQRPRVVHTAVAKFSTDPNESYIYILYTNK